MAELNKVKKIHDYMPGLYDTRTNSNWKALIEAIGTNDQDVADLIESVRKQFFVKTASRPYIDRLGTANNVQRPRFVGMDDPTFRDFIPIMSYNPKQVKIVLDKLLDLFFFKNSTTSYIQTYSYEPFTLSDGWTLEYDVDGLNKERIQFSIEEFQNINAATANEIVSAINRQSKYTYAIAHEDSISKRIYIRIFTNTIGSKGSLSMDGGLANIGMKFNGFNFNSGNGANTVWDVTVVGDTVTFKHTGGEEPGLESINVNDIALIDLDLNRGSFVITDVNASNGSFSFKGLFNTPGTYTQTSIDQLKFLLDETSHIYKQSRRALTWEVKPGEIIVEIPPSPPVVKRNRKGASHLNGVTSLVNSYPSTTSIELKDSEDFPEDGGKLLIEKLEEIKTEITSTNQTDYTFHGRLTYGEPIYTYESRVGDILMGISPELPYISDLNKYSLISIERLSNELTVETNSNHGYTVSEYAIISDVPTFISLNGTWKITEIVNNTTFKCLSPGLDGSDTVGSTRVEKMGLSINNSKIVLRSSKLEPDMEGPYMWDINSEFVLSSYTTNILSSISAGTTNRNILVEANDLPNEEGRLIFDFGTEKQEGPVRYFYKPSTLSIAIDPAYVFKYTHAIGSAVTKINKKGGIQYSGDGSERSPYVTDPAAAREVLKELMESVKSVGVFLNFMIRFPKLYYGTVDTYKSGVDPDEYNG